MRAMVLDQGKKLLSCQNVAKPQADEQQVLIKVEACGVCRTDLHIVDQDLKEPSYPRILGHQVVGVVAQKGSKVREFSVGDRVGVPWLAGVCEACEYCFKGQENLCDQAQFTGYDLNGGYAEYCVSDSRFCVPLSSSLQSFEVAPLLCAGLIGFRAYRMLGDARDIGLYGFGSSAHILLQLAVHEQKNVYLFTRANDFKSQNFAKKLGAYWVGGSDQAPPKQLDGAIVFAPVGSLMVTALKQIKKGASVISAGIHMSDIPAFAYQHLWGERRLCSVANLTRDDARDFFQSISQMSLQIKSTVYPLEQANEALDAIRQGSLEGSVVLKIS